VPAVSVAGESALWVDSAEIPSGDDIARLGQVLGEGASGERDALMANAAGGGRAHLYELTWSAPGMGGGLGACHGLDVPLVFGNLSSGQPAMLIGDPPSPAAEELSAQIRRAWTAFAAHGDPGWPSYETGHRRTQLFDTPSMVTAYPEETSRRLWQDHVFPALPLLAR
jgi:para-nitrobenzyl esterase